MAEAAGVRKDDEENERKEVRRAEEEEKGTAIFLNIEGGESNAAAFERSWEAAPSCFKCGFPKMATFSARPTFRQWITISRGVGTAFQNSMTSPHALTLPI
jgi:hypothetical protein